MPESILQLGSKAWKAVRFVVGESEMSFFPLSFLGLVTNIQTFMRREPKRSMLSQFFLFRSIAIECTNHTVLNEASRSRFFTNYIVSGSDTSLTGWFTFNGSAGTRMATTCVPADHCGTFVPGWLAGNHPSVDEGVVVRSVCLSKSRVCCMTSLSVLVRNCSGFFVYKLDVNSSFSFTFRVCGSGIEGNVIFSDLFSSIAFVEENPQGLHCEHLLHRLLSTRKS